MAASFSSACNTAIPSLCGICRPSKSPSSVSTAPNSIRAQPRAPIGRPTATSLSPTACLACCPQTTSSERVSVRNNHAAWRRMLAALRRRLGQRLARLDDVNPEHLERLVAGLGVVNRAFRNLIGFAGLDDQRRLAVDQKVEFALKHIAGFGAGMGMAARG